ncbi:MAG: OadG family protein [Bacteroidales bacterium]|jgi:sodium pump decarboxylase gamma subunit|nr:OadG family protein [Bacteroidales bacterium]
MILHDIANLSEGTNILIVGISVVFLVLLIMVLFIHYMKPVIDYFSSLGSKVKEKSESKDIPANPSELSGQENAAISMAIYMYLAEQHDYESGVVTIKTVKKAYSPWNSKIYGMNNTLNR